MFGAIFWFVAGMLVGATFTETIRAFVRKVTKGRFFGPVPASEKSTLDLKDKAP